MANDAEVKDLCELFAECSGRRQVDLLAEKRHRHNPNGEWEDSDFENLLDLAPLPHWVKEARRANARNTLV